MGKFIGGPLDGRKIDGWIESPFPTPGGTFTAAMELEGPGVNYQRAPYRYKASEDGEDWVFDSYGEDVIEQRPKIVDTKWGRTGPQWSGVRP